MADRDITAYQWKRRRELDAIIEQNKEGFVECGRALSEAKDSQLYKLTHKTFNAYCIEVHGFQPRHAYELIAHADVMENLREKLPPLSGCAARRTNPPGDCKLPSIRESQLLAKLPMNKQAEVWEQVRESENRSDTLKEAVHAIRPPKPRKPKAAKPPEPPVATPGYTDLAEEPDPPESHVGPSTEPERPIPSQKAWKEADICLGKVIRFFDAYGDHARWRKVFDMLSKEMKATVKAKVAA